MGTIVCKGTYTPSGARCRSEFGLAGCLNSSKRIRRQMHTWPSPWAGESRPCHFSSTLVAATAVRAFRRRVEPICMNCNDVLSQCCAGVQP